MKWRIAELNKERRELLKLIGDSFFSESSETPIPLSNQGQSNAISVTRLSEILKLKRNLKNFGNIF